MIDLKTVPRSAFGWALENNLRRLGPLYKVYHHFAGALAYYFQADAVWLNRRARGRRPFQEKVQEEFVIGDASLRFKTVRRFFTCGSVSCSAGTPYRRSTERFGSKACPPFC